MHRPAFYETQITGHVFQLRYMESPNYTIPCDINSSVKFHPPNPSTWDQCQVRRISKNTTKFYVVPQAPLGFDTSW